MSWLSLFLILGLIFYFTKKQYKVQRGDNKQIFEDRQASLLRIQEITDNCRNSKRLQLREKFLNKLKEMEEADNVDTKTGDSSR